jgi:hypothetical protein
MKHYPALFLYFVLFIQISNYVSDRLQLVLFGYANLFSAGSHGFFLILKSPQKGHPPSGKLAEKANP